jgi:hypothetical protein
MIYRFTEVPTSCGILALILHWYFMNHHISYKIGFCFLPLHTHILAVMRQLNRTGKFVYLRYSLVLYLESKSLTVILKYNGNVTNRTGSGTISQ